MPTRFPNGLTTVKKAAPMGEFILPDPTTVNQYFEDFDRFRAADWIITVVEAGTGSATQVLGDGDGGRLLLTNDNAGGDRINLNLAAENISFEVGKRLWFSIKMKITDLSSGLSIVGLVPKTVTNPVVPFPDGVHFDISVAQFNIVIQKNSNTTFVAISEHGLTNDTDFILSFLYNGSDKIDVFLNGVKVITASTVNLPDDEFLGPIFFIENLSAAVHTMNIDYILVAKER